MNKGTTKLARKLIALSIMTLSSVATEATSIAPITLANLFSRSSEVAKVHIVSGDGEHYQFSLSDSTPWPVCKLKVIEAFKGVHDGDTVFLAPCTGMELDSDYILFLENTNAPSPKTGFEESSYGVIKNTKRVSDAGYGSMRVTYICAFDGRVPDRSCDYGVELNPSQVVLPRSLKVFPKSEATAETNYKRWVRQEEFVSSLRALSTEAGKSTGVQGATSSPTR
jgi:hypothetical protein